MAGSSLQAQAAMLAAWLHGVADMFSLMLCSSNLVCRQGKSLSQSHAKQCLPDLDLGTQDVTSKHCLSGTALMYSKPAATHLQ